MPNGKQFSQAEALATIKAGDDSAYGLLLEHAPKSIKKFDRAVKTLKEAMDEIRVVFPDATYYSASGTLCLMLGDSHDDHDRPQQKLVAATGVGIVVDGGDW